MQAWPAVLQCVHSSQPAACFAFTVNQHSRVSGQGWLQISPFCIIDVDCANICRENPCGRIKAVSVCDQLLQSQAIPCYMTDLLMRRGPGSGKRTSVKRDKVHSRQNAVISVSLPPYKAKGTGLIWSQG